MLAACCLTVLSVNILEICHASNDPVHRDIENTTTDQNIPSTMPSVILETNVNRDEDGGLYAELIYNRAFPGRFTSHCIQLLIMTALILEKYRSLNDSSIFRFKRKVPVFSTDNYRLIDMSSAGIDHLIKLSVFPEGCSHDFKFNVIACILLTHKGRVNGARIDIAQIFADLYCYNDGIHQSSHSNG